MANTGGWSRRRSFFLYLLTQNNVKNEIEDNDEIIGSQFRDTVCHKTDLTVYNILRDQR